MLRNARAASLAARPADAPGSASRPHAMTATASAAIVVYVDGRVTMAGD